jgi:hypothetical protein
MADGAANSCHKTTTYDSASLMLLIPLTRCQVVKIEQPHTRLPELNAIIALPTNSTSPEESTGEGSNAARPAIPESITVRV